MINPEEPLREGHTREWQDRARVVPDPMHDVQEDASPNQSPAPGAEEKNEECGKRLKKENENY